MFFVKNTMFLSKTIPFLLILYHNVTKGLFLGGIDNKCQLFIRLISLEKQ